MSPHVDGQQRHQLQSNKLQPAIPKRYFGISRHLDPLAPVLDDDDSEDLITTIPEKKVYTADDLEYEEIKGSNNAMSRKMNEGEMYWGDGDDSDDDDDEFSNMFGLSNDDNDDKKHPLSEQDELSIQDKAYAEKQAIIKAELDKRTGRLWTDEWVIPDEEWMSTDTWDDIEEWRPELATRKSLESVKVFDGKAFFGSIGSSILLQYHRYISHFHSFIPTHEYDRWSTNPPTTV